jgi:hypothetical protein
MKPLNFYQFVRPASTDAHLQLRSFCWEGSSRAPRIFAQDSAPGPAVPSEVDPPILAVEKPIPAIVDDVALNGPPETYVLPPAPAAVEKKLPAGRPALRLRPSIFNGVCA